MSMFSYEEISSYCILLVCWGVGVGSSFHEQDNNRMNIDMEIERNVRAGVIRHEVSDACPYQRGMMCIVSY